MHYCWYCSACLCECVCGNCAETWQLCCVRLWLYLCCVCTLLYVLLLWHQVVYSSISKMYVNLVCLILLLSYNCISICVTYWYGELYVVTSSGPLFYTLWYLPGFLHMSRHLYTFRWIPRAPLMVLAFSFCFRGGKNSPTEGMFNWGFS